jgi:hypothetical protein
MNKEENRQQKEKIKVLFVYWIFVAQEKYKFPELLQSSITTLSKDDDILRCTYVTFAFLVTC